MADIVTGFLAFGECLGKLLKFAEDVGHAGEDLKRYHKVLTTIRRTVAIMQYLASQSELHEKLSALSSNKRHNIIDSFAEDVQSIIQDLMQLLNNLELAKKEIDSRSSTWDKWKGKFRDIIGKGKIVVHRAHINDLIQSAKHIESSLHNALSTILLVNSNIRTTEVTEMLQDYGDTVREQHRDFKDLHRACQTAKTPVAYVKKIMTKEQLRSLNPKAKGKRGSKRSSWLGANGRHTVIPNGSNSNYNADNISTSSLATVGTQDQEALTSDIVIYNDGTRSVVHGPSSGVDSAMMTLNPDPETEDTASDLPNQTTACVPETEGNKSDILEEATASDKESVEWSSPESEAFDLDLAIHAESSCWAPLGDGFDIEINSEALFYLDKAITMMGDTPPSPSEELSFCVETWIIQESGLSVLILRQRCDPRPSGCCAHVLINSSTQLSTDYQLPHLLRGTLREEPSLAVNSSHSPEGSRLKLVATHGFDTRRRYTKLLKQAERCEQVAITASFWASLVMETVRSNQK
ncbi:hypothetical protein ASPCAL06653 [Aspergillus calidoustus]|uniref:Uncharacterized protein n=1 Tax=Aspergillus calidoustus TaxID=454130 RepID=A0A0U5G7J9_ASPCI|nr:hypothetical protein ASPCAL06653 [Aspergillus calidoustus]